MNTLILILISLSLILFFYKTKKKVIVLDKTASVELSQHKAAVIQKKQIVNYRRPYSKSFVRRTALRYS